MKRPPSERFREVRRSEAPLQTLQQHRQVLLAKLTAATEKLGFARATERNVLGVWAGLRITLRRAIGGIGGVLAGLVVLLAALLGACGLRRRSGDQSYREARANCVNYKEALHCLQLADETWLSVVQNAAKIVPVATDAKSKVLLARAAEQQAQPIPRNISLDAGGLA